MGRNKLKDVFSMEPPQPEIEVVFRDAEAQKEFEEMQCILLGKMERQKMLRG